MSTHEPPLAEGPSPLVDRVIQQIQTDIRLKDVQSLDELLRACPRINLIQYLDEEEWDEYLTTEERKQLTTQETE